jgi:hypothetical protein
MGTLAVKDQLIKVERTFVSAPEQAYQLLQVHQSVAILYYTVAGTSVACTLDLSFSSWVTKFSVPINIIIIIL